MPFLAGVGGAEARIVQLDAMARERGDLRDPRAHRAGADHGDGRSRRATRQPSRRFAVSGR